MGILFKKMFCLIYSKYMKNKNQNNYHTFDKQKCHYYITYYYNKKLFK